MLAPSPLLCFAPLVFVFFKREPFRFFYSFKISVCEIQGTAAGGKQLPRRGQQIIEKEVEVDVFLCLTLFPFVSLNSQRILPSQTNEKMLASTAPLRAAPSSMPRAVARPAGLTVEAKWKVRPLEFEEGKRGKTGQATHARRRRRRRRRKSKKRSRALWRAWSLELHLLLQRHESRAQMLVSRA